MVDIAHGQAPYRFLLSEGGLRQSVKALLARKLVPMCLNPIWGATTSEALAWFRCSFAATMCAGVYIGLRRH
jgi:hypothetical protein